MIKLVKENLDMDELNKFREEVESKMDQYQKFFLNKILYYNGRLYDIDLDRFYSDKKVLEFIKEASNYLDFHYDTELEELILEWFRGYFLNKKSKYKKEGTFVYSNPHPDGKNIGDCVKRAIVNATGKDYMEVQRELNRIKREIGGKAYNDNKVWREFCKSFGFEKITIPNPKRGEPRMDGNRFCQEYPEGSYILRMARHLTCCKDGKIYDSWDCRDKAVYQAYLVKGGE